MCDSWGQRLSLAISAVLLWGISATRVCAEPLPGTAELTWDGDLAARLVDTADAFLLRRLDQSLAGRANRWQRNVTDAAAYETSIAENRRQLLHVLGVRDARPAHVTPEIVLRTTAGQATDTTGLSWETRVGRGAGYDVYLIRWAAVGDIQGIGLLLLPDRRSPRADLVLLPDCEVSPEQFVGLAPGLPESGQWARHLAAAGCRVVIPLLVDRRRGEFDWGPRPAPQITNREMLYRSAFEVGRGLIGYEVQQVQALIDWFAAESDRPIGVAGWGEGGLLALYAGAVDPRIKAVGVSGYFDSRQAIWQEPIDRNVFGLLDQWGDAELASLIAPRTLIVEAARGPVAELPGQGGAPARLASPELARVQAELERARAFVRGLPGGPFIQLVVSGSEGQGPAGTPEFLGRLLMALGMADVQLELSPPPTPLGPGQSTAAFRRDHLRQLDRHTQHVLQRSAEVRRNFFAQLDTSSTDSYRRTIEHYREHFATEVIGRYDIPLSPPQPRTRQVYETANWRAYEVVLDVFDSVFAYGLVLLPKDLQPGERRPVVVCQHGLEGRPQDTVGIRGSNYYAGFAGQLADRGFITFAPQNLYIGEDRFRTLQRKSYPLQKTIFSLIVPQHQQIVNWLKTLDGVDPQRIAFYGLSYGGKTAMRVPPLVTDYCLSICSADFNEWVDKNASTTNPRSYVWSGEYEIFEFDLGSTFNYAEMAALIAPRPFMVERGHFDGVADDWTVAAEFSKVRYLYAAKLGLADRCRIEWFVGPHKINGQGTYDFLHEHLQWPRR